MLYEKKKKLLYLYICLDEILFYKMLVWLERKLNYTKYDARIIFFLSIFFYFSSFVDENERDTIRSKYFLTFWRLRDSYQPVRQRPKSVVVHSRSSLPAAADYSLGNHVLVKFNFVIIRREAKGDKPTEVWWRGILRGTWKSFYLSFSYSATIAHLEKKPPVPWFPISFYFFFQVRLAWLSRERSINYRVLVSTTPVVTSTGTPRDDSPLSWFFTSWNPRNIDRDIDIKGRLQFAREGTLLDREN